MKAGEFLKSMAAGRGAWFALTEKERQALVLILALALLGVTVKFWHVRMKAKHDAGTAMTVAPGTQSRPASTNH